MELIPGHDGPVPHDQDVGARADDAAEAIFTHLVGDSPAAVTIIVDGRIVYANAAAEQLVGQPAGGLLGQQIMCFVHADDAPQVRRRLLLAGRAQPAELAGSFETNLISSHGELIMESLVHSVNWDGKQGVGLISCDVTARQAREIQLTHDATHDPLTGLANRALLLDRLEQSMARIGGSCDAVLLMLLDLDGFKNVNDTHGHAAGDQILRDVAARLGEAMRGSDTVARLSGDEFVICADLNAQHPGATAVRKRVDAVMSTGYQLGGVTFALTAGIGSMVITQAAPPLVVLADVDQRMYTQKRLTSRRR